MSRSWGDSGRLACPLHRSRVSKAGELAALRLVLRTLQRKLAFYAMPIFAHNACSGQAS